MRLTFFNMTRKKSKKKSKNIIKIRNIFLSQKNLFRDIIVVAVSFLILILLIINNSKFLIKKDLPPQPAIINNNIEQEAEDPIVDATNWKSYKTDWYGFELKYPENWSNPILENTSDYFSWEYRYQFRKPEIEENNPFIGFDVVVYNLAKVGEFYNTDEFPDLKDENKGITREIRVPMLDNEDYAAEQVYIDENDEIYEPVYFYTLIRDEYIYNITPVVAEGENEFQSKKEVIKNFPEFITVASTFNLIDIKRPIPNVSAKVKINAPRPAAETKRDSLGRMICKDLKHDKPHKSFQSKKKHLDMECCLDPDEYPNPHCYYPPEKYGKYL